MTTRQPHVAGSFYPANPDELKRLIRSFEDSPQIDRTAKAVVLPHAGYIYSARTAWKVLQQTRVPETVLMLGPNHCGTGKEMALYDRGSWATPLGDVRIDENLAESILKQVKTIEGDRAAHSKEHSLEVIVPMLQLKNSCLRLVPIIIGTMDFKFVYETAVRLADLLSQMETKPLLVVSTDMNHYESDEISRRKDQYALDAIRALDAGELIRSVRQHRISMCGVMPVYILLVMAEKLGIKKAELTDYRNSAEVSGDYDRVVGYAGFILD